MLSLYESAHQMLTAMNEANGVNVLIHGPNVTKRALIVQNAEESQSGAGYQIFGVNKSLIVPKDAHVDALRVGDELTISGTKYRVTAIDGAPRSSIAPLNWVRVFIVQVT